MKKEQSGLFRFNRRNRWLLYIILMAMAVLFSMQQKKDKAEDVQTADKQEQVLIIAAGKLAQNFIDNPQDAQQRFQNKRLQVFGEVSEAGTALGKTYVKFVTGEKESRVRYFAGSDKADWAKSLKPGEQVTVTGKFQGYISQVVVLE